MRAGRGRARATTALALALALSLAALPAAATGAKKKGAKAKTFAVTKAVNETVPNGVPGSRSTPLTSTITVGKKFKGRVVGDINVTGIQTTGSAAAAASQLTVSLSAPSGRTIDLFLGVGDQSLGPWTIDDDTSTAICNFPPPTECADPVQTLARPFAGTSNTVYNLFGGIPTNGPLATFNGVPMRGNWTLWVSDQAAGPTSVFHQWGLRIAPAKPVKPVKP